MRSIFLKCFDVVGLFHGVVLGWVIRKGNCDCGKRYKGNSRKVRTPYDNAIPLVLSRPAFQGEGDSRGDYSKQCVRHLANLGLQVEVGDSWKLLTGFDFL